MALADVRLERQDTTCASESSGCEEISLAPVLVDLPLVPGALPQFSVQLPVGAYEQISFQLHKVTSQDPADLQPLLDAGVPAYVRGEAVTILGLIGTDEALRLLRPLPDDPDPQVREIVRDILAAGQADRCLDGTPVNVWRP